MKKINNLHLEALKEKLYIAFIIFVLEVIAKFPIIEQMFPQFVANIKAAYNHMNAIYLKYDAEFCTEQVQEADAARDIAFRKFRDTVKMFITFPETAEKTKAAEIIMKIIEMYGGNRIPNQGMMAKTTSIVNLVEDLEEKYPTEVTTLGVGSLVSALKQAQAVFDDKFMQRAECESEVVKGAMLEARRKMSEVYRDFVTTVNIAAKSDSEGVLTDFINLMNVGVGRYRTYTGQGQVSSDSSSDSGEEGEEVVLFKTATFNFKNGNSIKLKVEVGAPLEAPANTEGYKWKPEVPEFMPAKNCIFREVSIAEEEATATFHFYDHREEEIKQIIGSILTAPANTNGYHWDPTVPATMPAEDTSYYELPDAEQEPTTPTKYTITFVHNGQTVGSLELEPGAAVTAPSAPSGYHWVDVPATMPARNVTINSAQDVNEPPSLTK